MASGKIDIYGQLNAATSAGVLADAAQIKDFLRGKTQEVINTEVLQKIAEFIKVNTTAYWQEHSDYVPTNGEIVVYSDYEKDDENKDVPGIKVGTGNAYVGDLTFIGEALKEDVISHIGDTVSHITAEERNKWNNKINVSNNEQEAVVGETLIITRN